MIRIDRAGWAALLPNQLSKLAFDVLMKMLQCKGKAGSEHVFETELVVRSAEIPCRASEQQTTHARMNA